MSHDSETTRFIISDLHLGKNDDFDIFKADGKEEAFESFLKFCAGHDGPVELVINGDFVDFLQLKPWDAYRVPAGAKQSFVKDAAVKKAGEIAIAHARVFRALGRFLGDAKNRLVVLLGNHDVELAYDEVWAVIHDAITGGAPIKGSINFINRATQYNFEIGGVVVHVQHGNIRDQWNEIVYKELFENAEKDSGFDYPPGTLLVYKLMNDFKEQFRFVDMLKPEMPAVPLLLLRLAPSSAAKLPAVSVAYLASLKNGFLGRMRQWVGGGNFGPRSSVTTWEQNAHIAMANAYVDQAHSQSKTIDDLDVDHLDDVLNDPQLKTQQAKGATFGPRWDSVKASFVKSILNCLGRPTLTNDKIFFQTDQKGADVDSAATEFIGKVKIVVFGHTHAALKNEIPGKGLYLNSGAWANLIALPADEKDFAAWLESIADNTFKRTSFPTYVRLAPAPGGVTAILSHWSAAGEEPLWSKNISASN